MYIVLTRKATLLPSCHVGAVSIGVEVCSAIDPEQCKPLMFCRRRLYSCVQHCLQQSLEKSTLSIIILYNIILAKLAFISSGCYGYRQDAFRHMHPAVIVFDQFGTFLPVITLNIDILTSHKPKT